MKKKTNNVYSTFTIVNWLVVVILCHLPSSS